jgi:hypothetical protein
VMIVQMPFPQSGYYRRAFRQSVRLHAPKREK